VKVAARANNAFYWYCCFRSGFALQVKRPSSLPTVRDLRRRSALLRLQVMPLRDFFYANFVMAVLNLISRVYQYYCT